MRREGHESEKGVRVESRDIYLYFSLPIIGR